MNLRVTLAALALVASAQPACLVRGYEPLHVAISAPSVVRAQAIREYALDMDMYIARHSPDWTVIELVSRPERGHRDRIRIDGSRDAVDVSYWTEISTGYHQWTRSDAVCLEYSHAREREVARRIKAIIRRSMLL